MRGIVFTEFMEMVESQYGYTVVNKILESSLLKSGGVYTAIGTYDHQEIFVLAERLSLESGLPTHQLFRHFGEYFFKRITEYYPHFMRKEYDLFTFLESMHNYIHREVKKIHPDSELPYFETKRINERTLELLYQSKRDMGDLAYGLLRGAAQYYNSPVEIAVAEKGRGDILFTITLV